MEVYPEKTMERLNSGVFEDNLQKHVPHCHHWSDDKWKSSMAEGGGHKRFLYCTDSSGATLCLRALQGHSGRNDVCFCQELVCETATKLHCNSECDISTDCCGDRGQRASVVDFSNQQEPRPSLRCSGRLLFSVGFALHQF